MALDGGCERGFRREAECWKSPCHEDAGRVHFDDEIGPFEELRANQAAIQRVHRRSRTRAGLRFWFLLGMLGSVTTGAAMLAIPWLRRPPRVEPAFERLVGEGAGPIKQFALRDVRGTLHTAAEWSGRPAIVLVSLATDCAVANAYAPEMIRLYERFWPRRVLFLGIHAGPHLAAERAAEDSREYALPFPILFDRDQVVTSQAGIRTVPEAVVFLPDGQVVYRGRIDDSFAPGRRQRLPAQAA